MADIFISYAKKDREKVEPIANALTKQGWSVFWDRTIPGGKTWDEVIEEELDAARCVVVVWSKISIKSRWVRAEAEEGLHRNILVPVSIEAEKEKQRLAEEERKQKEAEAKRKAEEEQRRKVFKAEITPETPEPDTTTTTESKSPEPRITTKALKFSVLVGVVVLLSVGIWWCFFQPPAKEVKQELEKLYKQAFETGSNSTRQ